MKISIESASSPVPLCFGACLMVWHMSPGRWYVWVGWFGGWKFRWGNGSELRFLTVRMLWRLMVAMGLVVLSRAMAVL